jgi:hypothetical protein
MSMNRIQAGAVIRHTVTLTAANNLRLENCSVLECSFGEFSGVFSCLAMIMHYFFGNDGLIQRISWKALDVVESTPEASRLSRLYESS